MKDVNFKYSLNIALNVRDAGKAIKFYEKTMGLGLVSLHDGEGCGIEMSAGPLALWIDSCSKKEESDVGRVFFEFETNNLDSAKVKLESEGAVIGTSTNGDNFKGFMVTDPYGMRFHVYQKSTVM
ncbi:MAG: VOC family protein [Bdellovibrionaceae bacterium]|nr:VOC family protein [Pseudobdellovibrionaceae bacterium]